MSITEKNLRIDDSPDFKAHKESYTSELIKKRALNHLNDRSYRNLRRYVISHYIIHHEQQIYKDALKRSSNDREIQADRENRSIMKSLHVFNKQSRISDRFTETIQEQLTSKDRKIHERSINTKRIEQRFLFKIKEIKNVVNKVNSRLLFISEEAKDARKREESEVLEKHIER
jgi:hypothetical protein